VKDTPEPVDKKQLSLYQLGRCRVLAEYDFKVLGDECEVDFDNLPFYPPKIGDKTHYFQGDGNLEWKEFKLFTWIQATEALNLPVSQETETWHSHLSSVENRVEIIKFLGHFKLENQKPFDTVLEFEYHGGPSAADPISSIKFEIPSELPEGDWKKELNNTLQDSTDIPTLDGAF
jgi:hypothetical protein